MIRSNFLNVFLQVILLLLLLHSHLPQHTRFGRTQIMRRTPLIKPLVLLSLLRIKILLLRADQRFRFQDLRRGVRILVRPKLTLIHRRISVTSILNLLKRLTIQNRYDFSEFSFLSLCTRFLENPLKIAFASVHVVALGFGPG